MIFTPFLCVSDNFVSNETHYFFFWNVCKLNVPEQSEQNASAKPAWSLKEKSDRVTPQGRNAESDIGLVLNSWWKHLKCEIGWECNCRLFFSFRLIILFVTNIIFDCCFFQPLLDLEGNRKPAKIRIEYVSFLFNTKSSWHYTVSPFASNDTWSGLMHNC